MDSATQDLLLQKLEEFIIDEEKIVRFCGNFVGYVLTSLVF